MGMQGVKPIKYNSIPAHMFEVLGNTHKRSLLHNSVALLIARSSSANQLPTIKSVFHELDQTGRGHLNKIDICAALERCGIERERAFEATDAMDLSRDGTVSWTEFVAACICLKDEFYEKDLR